MFNRSNQSILIGEGEKRGTERFSEEPILEHVKRHGKYIKYENKILPTLPPIRSFGTTARTPNSQPKMSKLSGRVGLGGQSECSVNFLSVCSSIKSVCFHEVLFKFKNF